MKQRAAAVVWMIKVKSKGTRAALSANAQPAPRTSRYSNFLITVNTNITYVNQLQATTIGDDLVDVADELFEPQTVGDIIKFRDSPRDMSLIEEVEAEYQPELGGKRNMVHMHIFVKIKHRVPGKGIHIDYQALREFFRTHGKTRAVRNLPYLHIKAFSGERTVAEYVRKGTTKSGKTKSPSATKPLPTEEQVRREVESGVI